MFLYISSRVSKVNLNFFLSFCRSAYRFSLCTIILIGGDGIQLIHYDVDILCYKQTKDKSENREKTERALTASNNLRKYKKFEVHSLSLSLSPKLWYHSYNAFYIYYRELIFTEPDIIATPAFNSDNTFHVVLKVCKKIKLLQNWFIFDILTIVF